MAPGRSTPGLSVSWPAPVPKLPATTPPEDPEPAAKIALEKSFVDHIFDVAKGSIDRARAGAEKVQTAATAIAGLYTTVLGVSFSVTEKPLPGRGLIAPIFLGAAIVASTV